MGAMVCYRAESEVEGNARTVPWNQESWSVISVDLTHRLTERVVDNTLDFRQMLSASNNVLEAPYSQDTLGCLAAAIV